MSILEDTMSTLKMTSIPSEPKDPENLEFHAQRRGQRLKLAALTSIGSKVITVLSQLLALPIAVHALGVVNFGVYAMLTASVSWMGMAQLGIGPALTLGISRASALQDRQAERRYFSSAFFLMLGVTILVGSLLLLIAGLLPVTTLFGPSYHAFTAEIRLNLLILIGLIVTRLLLSVTDAAQAGYQEQYICNLWAIVGNALGLLSLIFIVPHYPVILVLILCLTGLPILTDLANGARLIGSAHPYLRPKLSQFDPVLARSLLKNGAAFSVVILSSYLTHQFSIFEIGRLQGPRAAAEFSVMITMMTLCLGMVVMLAQPLWPALSDAVARHDLAWVRRTSSRMIWFSMLYACVIGGIIAVAGQFIVFHWYGGRITISHSLQLWFGLYFVLAVWEYSHYNILTGLNSLRGPAALMFGRSALMVVIGPVFVHWFGITGMAAALCAVQVSLSTWIFPVLLCNQLAIPEPTAGNASKQTESVDYARD